MLVGVCVCAGIRRGSLEGCRRAVGRLAVGARGWGVTVVSCLSDGVDARGGGHRVAHERQVVEALRGDSHGGGCVAVKGGLGESGWVLGH